MITTTFSGNKAIEINGKRYKPNASYEFTEKEWGEMYEKSFFAVLEIPKIKSKKKDEPISESD